MFDSIQNEKRFSIAKLIFIDVAVAKRYRAATSETQVFSSLAEYRCQCLVTKQKAMQK